MPERQFPLIINNDPNEMMILLDNKKEFIKLLDNILIPEIYGYMQILYDSSETLSKFQNKLSGIAEWRDKDIREFYKKIIKSQHCKWLDNLIAACFISVAKTMIVCKGNTPGITLIVPSSKEFIYQCLRESARNIWKCPDLYKTDGYVSKQIYENNQEIFGSISKSIDKTITKMLPLDILLKIFIKPDVNKIVAKTNDQILHSLSNKSQCDIKDTGLFGGQFKPSSELNSIPSAIPQTKKKNNLSNDDSDNNSDAITGDNTIITENAENASANDENASANDENDSANDENDSAKIINNASANAENASAKIINNASANAENASAKITNNNNSATLKENNGPKGNNDSDDSKSDGSEVELKTIGENNNKSVIVDVNTKTNDNSLNDDESEEYVFSKSEYKDDSLSDDDDESDNIKLNTKTGKLESNLDNQNKAKIELKNLIIDDANSTNATRKSKYDTESDNDNLNENNLKVLNVTTKPTSVDLSSSDEEGNSKIENMKNELKNFQDKNSSDSKEEDKTKNIINLLKNPEEIEKPKITNIDSSSISSPVLKKNSSENQKNNDNQNSDSISYISDDEEMSVKKLGHISVGNVTEFSKGN